MCTLVCHVVNNSEGTRTKNQKIIVHFTNLKLLLIEACVKGLMILGKTGIGVHN